MNREVIIHIGYPKTGTTWFANNFYSKIKNFELIRPDTLTNKLISDDFLDISKELNNNKNIVISDPEFCGVIRYNWNKGVYRQQIAERFKILFPNAKIVLFIRNQIEFLASSYVYYIRKGGTQKPLELFKSMINSEFSVPLEYMEYNKIISLYSGLFGKENINIFLYEDFLENNKLFIKNYIIKFDFKISDESVNFKPKNEMLKKPLLYFIRFSNKFTRKEVKNKKYIVNIPFLYETINLNYNALNKFLFFGRKPNSLELFDEETLLFLKSYYTSSNKILIEKMGLQKINKYNYPML